MGWSLCCCMKLARPKGRWYVFLRDLIGDQNRIQILQAIKDAVGDPDCVGIHFWVRFNPKNNPPGYEVDVSPKHPDANGKYWITITLLCDHEIDPTIPGDASDPPADGGESGPEHPNLRLTRARSAKRVVKKSARKAQKKTAKKKAKKKNRSASRANGGEPTGPMADACIHRRAFISPRVGREWMPASCRLARMLVDGYLRGIEKQPDMMQTP